jgi:uncharacterized damage-inducible protein DinB
MVTYQHSRRFAVAVFFVAVASVAPRADELSPQDRAKVVQYLTSTRDQVVAESATLSDAQWNFKLGPDRWSVGEVVEHLALTEEFLRNLQQKTMSAPVATAEQRAATKGKDEMIVKAIPDRTQKAQAPEPLRPTQKLGAQTAVVNAFKERRGKTLSYAEKTTDDLRAHVGESPIGPVDAYQWLLFIGAHTERHLAQIREVKASAQFPKM